MTFVALYADQMKKIGGLPDRTWTYCSGLFEALDRVQLMRLRQDDQLRNYLLSLRADLWGFWDRNPRDCELVAAILRDCEDFIDTELVRLKT